MAAPTVTSINPQAGSIYGGTSVVITGTNLNVSGTAVFFGDLPAASFVVDSSTQITAVSPAAPSDREADVYVSTNDGVSQVPPSARFYYFNPIPSPYYLNKNVFFDPDGSYVFYGDVVFAKDPLFASSPGGGSGPISGASNLGAGAGVYASELAGVLRFKSFTAGSGITITPSANEIQISASAGTAGWLTDGSNTGPGPLSFGTSDATGWSFVANGSSFATVGANGALTLTKGIDVTGSFSVNSATTIGMTGSDFHVDTTGEISLESSAGNMSILAPAGVIAVSASTLLNLFGNLINIYDPNGVNNPGIIISDTANNIEIQADKAGGEIFLHAAGTGGALSLEAAGNITLGTPDLLSTGMVNATGAGGAAPTSTPPAGYDYVVIDASGHIRRYVPTV